MSELNLYSKLVTKNSYIVVCDGIQKTMHKAARSKSDWYTNNPITAINNFLKNNKNFKTFKDHFIFNESKISKNYVTYWPKAYIKKIK
jgi:cephalosporin hydroxylase